MFVPQIHARMEEPNEFARIWICSGDVRTFVAIAMKAGERKIFDNRLAAVLTRNDVINVKRQRVYVGRKVAIFAPAVGTLPDYPDNLSVHE